MSKVVYLNKANERAEFARMIIEISKGDQCNAMKRLIEAALHPPTTHNTNQATPHRQHHQKTNLAK